MTNFPYEQKMIDYAMKLIPKDEVKEFSIIDGVKIRNYLIVYSNKSKKFFGISANRFLKNNYESAIILYNVAEFSYAIKRLLKNIPNNIKDLNPCNIQIFHYDNYLNDYGSDGYELLNKINSLNDIQKIKYSITFLKYPSIKKLVEDGYYNFVCKLINDTTIQTELIKVEIDNWRIDNQCKEYLNNNDYHPIEWLYLYKINEIDTIDFQQLQFLKTNNVSLMDIYYLLLKNNTYTVSSIIDYINRCMLYQAYNPRSAVLHLQAYIDSAKRLDINIDYYPNDLNKTFDFTNMLHTKFNYAVSKSINNEYHYHYKRRSYCYYSDNYYYIKPENDIELIKEISIIFQKYDITTYNTKDKDYCLLISKKTNKVIAIIDSANLNNKKQIKNKVIKYNNNRLSRDEIVFIKKWLEYKKHSYHCDFC